VGKGRNKKAVADEDNKSQSNSAVDDKNAGDKGDRYFYFG